MTYRRAICFLLHWTGQLNESSTRYYAWRCGICGERWKTPRAHGEGLDKK